MTQYRFVPEAADYSDFASGAVLHSAPVRPAFPVRLASELFQRAHDLWLHGAEPRPCVLYDPCCGTGYLLTVVALLHGPALRAVAGSDADPGVLPIAERNLALLTPAGMRSRMDALADLASRFGKPSHRLAVESAGRLLRRVDDLSLQTLLFHADALNGDQFAAGLGGTPVDVVLTDTPYGTTTNWAAETGLGNPGALTARMLTALRPVLDAGAVVVAVVPRGVRAEAPGYQRVQRFRAGHREALFWRAE